MDLYLIKYGELGLKKGNRKHFEKSLKHNIKVRLKEYKSILTIKNGRFYLDTDAPENIVSEHLSTTPGLIAFYKTISCSKDLDKINKVALQIAKKNLENGFDGVFKVETRRIDKSLPMNNYGYSAKVGEYILDNLPGTVVNVRKPTWTIHLELRDKAYLYGYGQKGPGGLPVGTAGKGMLLLSGGIDSPVAGFLMAKRGIKLSAVYFHTPPYTSDESTQKVKDLASILGKYNGGIDLYVVNFTKAQLVINKSVEPETTTLHSRASMMKIAEKIAIKIGARSLITGESLAQVASQTMESLHYTNAAVSLPVFRPCIGLDKNEIIAFSKKIGAYDTSIQPFDDCCTLFSPEHPQVKPEFDSTVEDFNNIEGLEELLVEASETEKEYIANSVSEN